MPFDFAALEASRLARGGRDFTAPCALPAGYDEKQGRTKFTRDDYAVAKVYDDARAPVPVKYNLSRDTAEQVAGRMRDGLTDAQVQVCIDGGWTYGAVAMKGGPGGNVPRTGKTAKRGFYPSRGRR